MFQIQLKRHREALNLSQQEFAELIGVKQSTVAMWENGSNKPRHSSLVKIAGFFHISIDELTGNAEDYSDSDKLTDNMDFVICSEIKSLSDEQKHDILDYIQFKKQNRQKNDIAE